MDNQSQLKQTILVVDDTLLNRKILTEELKQEYEVIAASTGFEALAKAKSCLPDLVLLDIIMPDMDGYQVLKSLKNSEETMKIPVIFLTSKDSEQDEIKGLNLGAVDYISKPFRAPILKARVKTHLELKRKTDILEKISSRDGLTGAFNRREFEKVIQVEWNRGMRFGHPLSLILLDLDHFKLYNDTYGHVEGDECLKYVVNILSSTLKRAGDFLARYGGEEFVALLPATPHKKGEMVAENIRQEVAAFKIEHKKSPTSQYVTASLGVATITPNRKSPSYHDLIEGADNALYKAKLDGRNKVGSINLDN